MHKHVLSGIIALVCVASAQRSSKPMKVIPSSIPEVRISAGDDVAVLENTSDRPIVAASVLWTLKQPGGKEKKVLVISDVFMGVGDAPHVIAPGGVTYVNRRSMTPIKEVGPQSGYMGALQPDDGGMEKAATLDAVIFADGEVAGPDVYGLALDIQARKAAAARVVHAVREAKDRPLDQVFADLRQPPEEISDLAVRTWNQTQFFAKEVLDQTDPPLRQAFLNHLDRMPQMGRTFRKSVTKIEGEQK